MGLERRQLGLISKIPCTLTCPPLSYVFCGLLCPAGESAGRPAAHIRPWIRSRATAGNTTVVDYHDPVTGAEEGRQVQKREAALPRLTTKPDSDLYNFGFKA